MSLVFFSGGEGWLAEGGVYRDEGVLVSTSGARSSGAIGLGFGGGGGALGLGGRFALKAGRARDACEGGGCEGGDSA